MSEIKIAIENCNNISKGVISLEEEKLNIRYGMNGTGKSTLSTAISLFSQGKPMDDLKPFGSDDEVIPTISIDGDIQGVRVFNEDDRKNNKSCKLEQHKALLYIDDVSEKYSNDMENNVYYECICLECGKHKDYKMSLNDRRHIIKTNLSPMETFMSFYEVRKRYLELIKQNCTVEEIIDNLNSFYKKNQEQGPVLTKKKN